MLNICWLHILVSDIDSSRFSQWKHCLSSSFALCYIWNREYKSNKLTLKPSKKKLKNRSNFSGKKLIPDYAYLKWRGSNIVASRCKSIAKYWLDIWLHLRKQIFEIKIKIKIFSLKFLGFCYKLSSFLSMIDEYYSYPLSGQFDTIWQTKKTF